MKAAWNIFRPAILVLASCLCACTKTVNVGTGGKTLVAMSISDTRASLPDEDAIRDVNLYVYDAYGSPFSHEYIQLSQAGIGRAGVWTSLTAGCDYQLFVLVNAGFDAGFMTMNELRKWKLYLNYPQGSTRGIPMAGELHIDGADRSGKTEVELERLMAKVCLDFNASGLDKDVFMQPVSATVGNCPRWITPFSECECSPTRDCFAYGYACNWAESQCLYLLESIDKSGESPFCPYVEVDLDYLSGRYASNGKDGLKYRFRLGGGVKRNNCLHISVTPRGNGLEGTDSWRTDTSFLVKR